MNNVQIRHEKFRGTSTVEFLVVLPTLLFVMLAIMELSRAWMTLNVVAAAAREGARVGVVTDPFDPAPAISRINTVLAGANLTPSTPPTVTCTNPLPCAPDSQVTATVTVNFSTLFPVIVPGLTGPIPLTNQAVAHFE
jgi:Flp pilus assembly protein TadG